MKKLFKKLSLMVVALLTFSVGSNYTVKEVKAADEKYVKVTEALDDWSGRYLIVYESESVAFNGSLDSNSIDTAQNFVNVSISDNSITSSEINYYFDINKVNGGYSVCSASGLYIGRSATSNGLNKADAYSEDYLNNISFSNGSVNISGKGGPKLQFYSQAENSRFRYYKSTQKTISLYKLFVEDNESNSDKIEKQDTTASLGFDYYIPESDNNYVKVTENLTDWTGKYLIGYETETDLCVFNGALGEEIDSINNYKTVSSVDNAVKSTAEIETYAFTFEKIENTETYSIKSSTGYYIGKTAYSNGLDKNLTKIYSNTISYDEGNPIITAEGNTTLKFNAASDQMRFRFYKSGQKDIVLYKLNTSSNSSDSNNPKFDNISILFGADLPSNLFEEFVSVSAGVKITRNNKTIDRPVSLNKDENGKYTSFSVGVIFEIFADNVYVSEETKDRLTTEITAQVYFVADGNTLELFSKTVTVLGMLNTYLGSEFAENDVVQSHIVALRALKTFIEAE